MALIGAHMSVAGGLDKAFERADALGCESMQIFTRSQRQWQARPVSLQEAEGFYRAWQRSNVKAVVSHASYLINIASLDAAVRAKSAAALREEVERCRHLNIDDIVLHPGFAMDAGIDAATANIAETLLRLFDATQEYKTRILLETMAGQGTCVGGDLAHFTEILDKANWHLNDSKAARGTHLDRHAHLGEGEIGLHPFALLMNDERFEETPTILETPKEGVGDEGNLSFLRKVRGQ